MHARMLPLPHQPPQGRGHCIALRPQYLSEAMLPKGTKRPKCVELTQRHHVSARALQHILAQVRDEGVPEHFSASSQRRERQALLAAEGLVGVGVVVVVVVVVVVIAGIAGIVLERDSLDALERTGDRVKRRMATPPLTERQPWEKLYVCL